MKVLFLDRDGVINVENEGGYILSVSDFKFYDQVPEAIHILNQYFDKVIVVTNQRCVGRGLITHEGLANIHQYMLTALKSHNAVIDEIYYAPQIEDNHEDRKPNIGMGLKAQTQYPEIDFSTSYMVGNNLSDMKFGKQLNMKTVFLSTTSTYHATSHETWCDYHFNSLIEFAQYFQSQH